METKFSPEEVIQLIDDFIDKKELDRKKLKIGSLTQAKLSALLIAKGISKQYQIFECERNNIDSVISYFIDKGLTKSILSENTDPFIFLLF